MTTSVLKATGVGKVVQRMQKQSGGIGVLAPEIVEKWKRKRLVINEEHKRLERCPSKKRSDIEINTIVSAYKFGSSGFEAFAS